ncbi:Rieske (2Fe-2S) protein [Sphingobium sp. SCG-1]|uniref:Rieske (2Fe-2S) protein n=1 Tax=Sphingobium sp. SCG-1 TaxID=2072936 RepID=UPI000CD677A4|nr:Rieske (2Fe-2S) protein [Sphingobium sp. SCG-1]AUW60304.1 Rieske (2Fe-2S) protein [Sphingobium sp. SCG-1]
MTETFHRVIKGDEIEERAMLPFVVNGWPVLLCREEGAIHALINRCTHAASQLAPDGRVRRGAVMCPLHGARFKLDTGECLGGAGYKPLKLYPWREDDEGWIEVAVPDEAPGMEHLPVKPLS